MNVTRIAQVFVVGVLLLWIIPAIFFVTVRPDEIGVRQSNFSGVIEDDLEPGWALRVPAAHKIIRLPRRYEYLEYADDGTGNQQQLQIRTKDNNIVFIDVSVPYHVRPGEAWEMVHAGNHQQDADGRFRFQRLAGETTVSVLREHLAELSSADFYSTDRRLEVAEATLAVLNEQLGKLHLEAERVLVRAVRFRPEYEQQLQQIQLNEQKKLLDAASETVARKQQTLDNFVQATNAQAAALEQRWIERRSQLERAYQLGFMANDADTSPGAMRRRMEALSPSAREELIKAAQATFAIEQAEKTQEIDDNYLLGIRNIEAETLEYDQRVRSEADGISGRLAAEGEALVAEVRGAFEGRVNTLLDSAAGRAYVAWKSADNVKFDSTLVFSSEDGMPSVLRLRELTERFMGKR